MLLSFHAAVWFRALSIQARLYFYNRWPRAGASRSPSNQETAGKFICIDVPMLSAVMYCRMHLTVMESDSELKANTR